jgi:hypothetical protein
MSYFKRNGRLANSAIVATIRASDLYITTPGDLDHLGPMKGLEFQRYWERKAFELGDRRYVAPAQSLMGFLDNRGSRPGLESSYRPGVVEADVGLCLRTDIVDAIREGIRRFSGRMKGFLCESANILAVETKTSAPVRILRDANRMSISHGGLYPAGEGAGYAGGITSSALDGLNVAEAIIAKKS